MVLSLKCHNCGATVYFDSESPATHCSHCGAHLKEMTDYTITAAHLTLKQKSADIDVNRERGISDARSRRDQSRAKSIALVYLAALAFVAGFILLFKSL